MENYTIKELREMGVKLSIETSKDIATSKEDLKEFLLENIDQKSIFFKGKEFQIFNNDCFENPLFWDNGFNFFNTSNLITGFKIIKNNKGKEFYQSDFESIAEIEAFLEKEDFITFKIYATSHGEVKLNPSYLCGFDSGVLGFFYISKEELRKNLNKARLSKDDIAKQIDLMKAFCDTLENYLNGEVYDLSIDNELYTIYGLNEIDNLLQAS